MKCGQLKLLAVSSAKRAGAAPGVSTVAETAGDPHFDFILWVGFFAPEGTPPDVVARLNSEINTIMASPSRQEKVRDDGADVRLGSSAQFGALPRLKAKVSSDHQGVGREAR